jgi:hypothetical protein
LTGLSASTAYKIEMRIKNQYQVDESLDFTLVEKTFNTGTSPSFTIILNENTYKTITMSLTVDNSVITSAWKGYLNVIQGMTTIKYPIGNLTNINYIGLKRDLISNEIITEPGTYTLRGEVNDGITTRVSPDLSYLVKESDFPTTDTGNDAPVPDDGQTTGELNFPINPISGDTYKFKGRQWIYNTTDNGWQRDFTYTRPVISSAPDTASGIGGGSGSASRAPSVPNKEAVTIKANPNVKKETAKKSENAVIKLKNRNK